MSGSDRNNGVMLEDELSFKDLLNGGAKFTLKSNFQEFDEMDDAFYSDTEVGDDDDDGDESDMSPWQKSFDELKQSMFVINENDDFKIFKKVVKQGTIAIEGKCRVSFNYRAFLEHSTKAFDSTYNTDPKTVITGMGELLLGIEYAVGSMKLGEESHFVVPYQLAWGEYGCPDRIPAKADILFIIHLLKVDQVGDENALDDVSEEDKRKYYVVVEKILEIKKKAIDFFKRKEYLKACRSFSLIIDKLELCQTRNEAEEEERMKHLVNMYVNSMICYNKLDLPKKVCVMYTNLKRLKDTRRDSKALYNHGIALMALGEYDRAKVELKNADRVAPNNPDITKQLCLLDEKITAYRQHTKDMWRKAMGNNEAYDPEGPMNISEGMKECIMQLMTELKDNPKESRAALPEGMSSEEVSVIEKLAKDMELKLVVSQHTGKNRIP